MSAASASVASGSGEPQQVEESSYCFKWSDYHNHLPGVVRQLLEEECMVDVTLVAAGERIQAHRIVLSSCSSLFQELLSQVNEDHSTIILSDISAQDVRAIVDYSYHGEVRIPVDNIGNLLEAAHSLKISGLMEIDGLDENDGIICTKDSNEDLTKESSTELNESDERAVEEFSGEKTLKKRASSSEKDDCAVKKNKRKRRKDSAKREYNEDMLVSAIDDLKAGQTLVEAATKNNIPRSTLYMRAKSLGIQLNASRNEYPAECMKAAIDAVIGGLSLQQASEKFYIPKTVLWRRIQKEGYQVLRSELKRSYGSDKREAAIKALQRGENLTKVALEFQIPKTTLFRDKVRLVDEGKLPESFWKKRKAGDEEVKRLRLEEAVAACRGGKMSQAVASVTYRIPKTTIWRRLQQEGKSASSERAHHHQTGAPPPPPKSGERNAQLQEGIGDSKNQQNPEFSLCEVSSEIPITYIDDNSLPEDSVIILTTEDVDGLNLETAGRQIIVNQDSGQEYVRCALSIGENAESSSRSSGSVGYHQPAES